MKRVDCDCLKLIWRRHDSVQRIKKKFKNIGMLTKIFSSFLSFSSILLMNSIKNTNCFQVVIDLGDEETEKAEEMGDWGSYLLLLIALSFPLSPAIALHFEALVDRIFQAIQKSMSYSQSGQLFPFRGSFQSLPPPLLHLFLIAVFMCIISIFTW